MKIFGILRAFEKISEKNLVTVDQKKCMRFLNKRSACSICMNNCPTGAIKPGTDDNIITVDGFLCTGCGICMNTCPNPVFSLEDMAFESIMKGVEDKEHIIISCFLNSCNVQVPCLGYLNESLLLFMASEGKAIELNTTACKQCENKAAFELIRGYAETANSILSSVGISEMIRIEERGALSGSGNESFTRKIISHFAGRESRSKNPRQMLFISALEKLGPTPGWSIEATKVPAGNLSIASSCNGCGMCSAICPMDALSAYDDEVFILKFKLSLCTGCGLCRQICGLDSITMDESICLADVINDEWKTLMKVEKEQCEGCGSYFIIYGDHTLCSSCQKNKDIEDTFFA